MYTPKKLLPCQIWSFLKTGSRICSYEESLVHKRTISHMKINKSNEINFLQLRPSLNKVNCLPSYVSRRPTPLLQNHPAMDVHTSSLVLREIGHAEYEKLQRKGVTVIDVRQSNEIKSSGTVHGSLNIPLDKLSNALNKASEDFKAEYGREKPNKNESVLFLCQRGVRSKKAMELASNLGYTKAMSYKDGWESWPKK